VNPLDAAPRRILSRKVYHTGNPRRSLLDFADPAVTEGRYHRKGGSGVWYASFRERGAWAEIFRHHESAEISPFEVRRRVGRARTHELVVLDLTKRSVQTLLQLTNDDIAGESYETCRRLAESARAAGFDGLLAPSGALSGETTLVVFADAMREGTVSEERSRIGTPPRRMLAHLHAIRVRGAAANEVRRLYRKIRRQSGHAE
jgi:hypothetical protein